MNAAAHDLELVVNDDESSLEALTVDGWFSLTTSQGTSKDKSESIDFIHRPRFTREEIVRSLYRGDAIAARIIDLIVQDSMSKGWSVEFFTTGEDGAKEKLDPVTTATINAKLIEWEKKVALKANVSLWWKRGRAYGGALMVFGADDGSLDKSEPLNLDTLKSFDWLRPLTRHEVSSGELATDPKQPEEFGKPARYFLHSRVVMSGELALGTQINATRGARFEGIRVDELASMLDNLDGWGDSIFERVWVPLRNWNSSINSAGTIVQDFSQSIYGIKGLRTILRAKGEALIAKQFQLQDQFRSIWNATVIDTEDTYERKTTNVSGMPELIDRFGLHLSAASGMPLTLLLGLSPGGFGTGEAEENNWINQVVAAQTEILVPLLETIYKILFATPDFRSIVPDGWKVVPVPLKQKSESDQAAIQKEQAETDSKYHAMGVLDTEEIAQSRFGKGEFSIATTLDEGTRKSFNDEGEEDEEEGEETGTSEGDKPEGVEGASGEAENPAATAMNGAQVTGLIDIVAKVITGEIPKDSAINILQVAYLLSPEDAAKVVGSAEAKEEEEEPAPVPGKGPPAFGGKAELDPIKDKLKELGGDPDKEEDTVDDGDGKEEKPDDKEED